MKFTSQPPMVTSIFLCLKGTKNRDLFCVLVPGWPCESVRFVNCTCCWAGQRASHNRSRRRQWKLPSGNTPATETVEGCGRRKVSKPVIKHGTFPNWSFAQAKSGIFQPWHRRVVYPEELRPFFCEDQDQGPILRIDTKPLPSNCAVC